MERDPKGQGGKVRYMNGDITERMRFHHIVPKT